MRRKRWWVVGGAVVVVGGLVALNLAQRGGDAKAVRIEEVGRRPIKTWVRAPGKVQPVVAVDISSNISGRVDRLQVREGDVVRRGDLLLTLDDTRLRSALAQYEAMQHAAQSQLALADAQRELAEQVRARREDLHSRGLLSAEELDAARVDVRVKTATEAAQRDEIERLLAARAEAERDLEESRFHAPIDGVVTAINLEEGENVLIGTMNNPGTVILTLSNLGSMEVEAQVNENDVVLVRPGQRADVTVDAQRDSTLAGTVVSVGESGTRASQDEGAEFEVLVGIDAPPDWLRPGMSADVEILVANVDSALAVPIQALVARSEETVAEWEARRARGETPESARKGKEDAEPEEREEKTAGEGEAGRLVTGIFAAQEGRARFQRIELGARGETYVEVRAGLDAEARVLTGPYKILRRLEDGERVKADRK